MNCPYCSNTVPDGAAFCGNCGAKLEAANLPPAMPPQPPAETPQEPASPLPAFVMDPVAPPPGFTPAYTPPPAPAKKSNTKLIIVIVVVLLLLCCCCAVVLSLGPISAMLTDLSGQLLVPTPRLK